MNGKIKTLLSLSLLFNLLLAGVIIVHIARMGPPPPHKEMEETVARLPENRQAEFRAMQQALCQESKEGRERFKALNEASLSHMKTEPFDEAGYDAAIGQLHQLRREQMDRTVEKVKQLARQWSPDERAILAELMRRPYRLMAECKRNEAPEPKP